MVSCMPGRTRVHSNTFFGLDTRTFYPLHDLKWVVVVEFGGGIWIMSRIMVKFCFDG